MNLSDDKKKAYKRSMWRNQGLGMLFVIPFVLFFVLYTLVPLLMGVGLSFFEYNPNKPDQMTFVGFLNYADLFGTTNESIAITFVQPFWESLLNTILFDLIAVPLLMIIPLMLAQLINYQPPGYKFFRAVLYMPVIVSITVAGMMFTSIFGESSTGLVNSLFGTNIKFLTDRGWRWFVMILLSVWWQTGTNFVIFSAGLRDIPKTLYEACEADGGGKASKFFHVTLPGLRGQIDLCLFSTLINYLNLYGQPSVIRDSTIYDTMFDSPMMLIQYSLKALPRWTGFICAMAVVFGLIVLAVSIAEKRLMNKQKGGHGYEKTFAAYKSVQK